MRIFLYVILLFATNAIIICSGFGADTWQYWAIALLHIASVQNGAAMKGCGNDD